MSKIIKENNKILPITCKVCGAIYEFEKGDKIEFTHIVSQGHQYEIFNRMVECPICKALNEIHFEGENKI